MGDKYDQTLWAGNSWVDDSYAWGSSRQRRVTWPLNWNPTKAEQQWNGGPDLEPVWLQTDWLKLFFSKTKRKWFESLAKTCETNHFIQSIHLQSGSICQPEGINFQLIGRLSSKFHYNPVVHVFLSVGIWRTKFEKILLTKNEVLVADGTTTRSR